MYIQYISLYIYIYYFSCHYLRLVMQEIPGHCLVAFDLFYFDYYAYFMQAKLDPGESLSFPQKGSRRASHAQRNPATPLPRALSSCAETERRRSRLSRVWSGTAACVAIVAALCLLFIVTAHTHAHAAHHTDCTHAHPADNMHAAAFVCIARQHLFVY